MAIKTFMYNVPDLPVVISEREVLQPVERKGVLIRKIQVIEYQGERSEARFWYNEDCKTIHHVDSIAIS